MPGHAWASGDEACIKLGTYKASLLMVVCPADYELKSDDILTAIIACTQPSHVSLDLSNRKGCLQMKDNSAGSVKHQKDTPHSPAALAARSQSFGTSSLVTVAMPCRSQTSC